LLLLKNCKNGHKPFWKVALHLVSQAQASNADFWEDVNGQISQKQEVQKNIWHRRLGHLSAKYLNYLQKNSVGIPII